MTGSNLLAYEPFSYPAGGSLVGANGGFGWSNGWFKHGSHTSPDPVASSNAMEYPGFGATSNVLEYKGSGGWHNCHLDRYFSKPLTHQVVWYSALLRYSGQPRNCHVAIGRLKVVGSAWIGLNATNSQFALVVDDTNRVQWVDTGIPFPPNETHLVVGRITRGAAHKTDRVDMWVDPPVGATDPGPPAATATNFSLGDPEYALCYHKFEFQSGTGHTDELRVGLAYTDVLPDASLRERPVLRYSFDADEGGAVTDLSGNGHHAVVHGATWTSLGRNGGGFSFGNGGHLRVPGSTNFNLPESTIAAWVKPANVMTAANDVLVSTLSTDWDAGGIQLHLTSGKFGFSYRSPGQSVSAEIPSPVTNTPPGTWMHIATTFTRTAGQAVITFYTNGQFAGEVAQTNNAPTYGGQMVYLGINYDSPHAGLDRHYSREYDGLMDDVVIYDRALPAGQILDLYQTGP